jgi:chemotaxis protein histidine kinase CheA
MKYDDAFERGLEAFNDAFRASLPDRLRQLDEIWHQLKAGDAPADAMRKLERGLHSLAGSGRTFGLPELSDAAAAAEACVADFGQAVSIGDAASRDRLERLLDQVRRAGSPH